MQENQCGCCYYAQQEKVPIMKDIAAKFNAQIPIIKTTMINDRFLIIDKVVLSILSTIKTWVK